MRLTMNFLPTLEILSIYAWILTVSLVKGGTFRHLGCWADTDADNHDIKESVAQMGAGISLDKCASYCAGRGFPFAGLQLNGACYCGNTYGSQGPSFDCNTTCGLFSCGGFQANDVYYAVDSDLSSQRVLIVTTNGKSFSKSRSACILDGGDMMTPNSDSKISAVANVLNASNSMTNVWVGLHRRVSGGAYEWTDENLLPSYESRSSDFASSWTASDPGLDCISVKISTKKLESMDCNTELPFACMQLPGSEGDEVTEETATDPPESISAESKRLALFVVLPLFLCCYGGSCIIYCVHKIIRNCAKARRGPAPPPDAEPKPPRPVPVVVGPPPGGLGAREKRPLSGSKVAPAPTLAYMTQPKAPEPGPTTEMKPLAPPSAKDREEARRARLLENAAREARERKQNSRPNTGVASSPPADDTAKLLDTRGEGAATPQGLSGMSINDIMKMKVAQKNDGTRKPRKIISS